MVKEEKLSYLSPRTVMVQLSSSRLFSSSKDPYYPYGVGVEDYSTEGAGDYGDNMFD